MLTPDKSVLAAVDPAASVYHLEITPSDVGNYDRVVVQDLLKEVAQTQQVDLSAKQRFKVVVINEADHLTRELTEAFVDKVLVWPGQRIEIRWKFKK